MSAARQGGFGPNPLILSEIRRECREVFGDDEDDFEWAVHLIQKTDGAWLSLTAKMKDK